MSLTLESYRAFISSPGDVINERDIAEETIKKISDICEEPLRVSLKVERWENLPPRAPQPEATIQDEINKIVEKSDFFILILYKRYGSVETGYKVSNTEREIKTIMKQFRKNPNINVLAYFKQIPTNEDPSGQEAKVEMLKQELTKKRLFFKVYEDQNEFRSLLTHDLYNIIMKMRLSTHKKKACEDFWKLGTSSRPAHPRLAILYPSVQREFMGDDKNLWLKRLKPNIYFEDFKAIQKLQKTLRLVGFSDYRIYTQTDIPQDYTFMNRIWICFPRFHSARQQLNKYQEVSRFNFTKRTNNQPVKIEWIDGNGEIITIDSPLAKYLEKQRNKNEGISYEWEQQMGTIIAKDYAIIARFKDNENQNLDTEESLRDYFFAGIRGLGTWGSAWFIDRKYNILPKETKSGKDIQMLLEVEYRNDRIFDVRDVSKKPSNYFKEENEDDIIDHTIDEFRKIQHPC